MDKKTEAEAQAPAEETKAKAKPADPVAVAWIGKGDRYVPWAPARDLTDHDVARLVYKRYLPAKIRPGHKAFKDKAAEVVADLVGTGLYKEA